MRVKNNKILHFFRQLNWSEDDLPPQTMPESHVQPVDLDDCDTDVKYFLKMFGNNNVQLLTVQSNIQRAKEVQYVPSQKLPVCQRKETRSLFFKCQYVYATYFTSGKLFIFVENTIKLIFLFLVSVMTSIMTSRQ